MIKKNSIGQSFDFYCYTDNGNGIIPDVNVIKIESDLTKWWPKIDLLKIFNKKINILFDLDIIILNPLERLFSVRTRTVSVLYSQWKEGFVAPMEKFSTLYNSSIMKWQEDQGEAVYSYFQKNKDMILTKYNGIDKFLFNEPVQVDLLPTSIAYSYWKGAKFIKDSTPEKLRNDYEICIFNEGTKQSTLRSWVKDYWL
jgi:hypothetical protein